MKVSNINIVIPSYNESKNISVVIEGVRKELPDSKIILVDDSNKKENEKTKRAIKRFKNVDLLSRGKKKGRGSAVLDGFKFGLKNKTAEYFFEMDSDLAQDPKELERFIKKIQKENADLVIGSRYMIGGRIANVSLTRRILSKIINKFLYILLRINVTDYTNGFRLYRKNAVEYLVNSDMKSTGFITLSESLYKLNKKGFKIEEVPITLYQRKEGKSTVNLNELTTSLIFIFKMKIEEDYLKFIKK